MAAEKLEEAAAEMGHSIHVETHGSIGVENAFSDEQIRSADAVVIAADKQIDTTRFKGIPIVVTGVDEGIKRPQQLIERALTAKPATGQRAAGDDADDTGTRKERESVGGTIYRALMNGVSHMIPFVVTGGLLIAIALAIGGEPSEAGLVIPEDSFWKTIEGIGGLAFGLMVPILSGFIAMAIADRPGLAPGMITGMIAVTGSLYGSEANAGFLGGIITGFASGYVALLIKKIPVHKYVQPIMPIIIIPIFTTLIVGLAFVFLLGNPIALAFTGLTNWLAGMTGATAIVLGLILGAMIAFDMGGPVNKTAFLFAGGLIATNAAPMGMVAAAIAVPPLGMGLATLIGRKLFNRQQKDSGIAALFMGFFGITEGAIPFAAARPLQVIPANMIGGAVAGAIAAMFAVKDNVMHGGPIVALLGAVENVAMYFVAIVVGALVTALVAIGLLSIGRKKDDDAPAAGEPALATAGAPAATARRGIDPAESTGTTATTTAAPAAAATTTETKADAPKITEYLSPETIDLNVSGDNAEQVIRQLAEMGAGTGAIGDVDTVVSAAMKREEQGPTAVGDGIAIPHAKSDGATRPVLAFGRSSGVDWQAPDGKPSDLIFLIAVPEAQAGDEHLRILAALSRALMRGPVRDGLRNADSADEVIRVLDEAISA
ncbi:MAG: PTS transporter subunit EIIA [Propionibacterium sp.]|nr:PTS transporter subunit EIIA [Propionibacterium sp.]